VSAPLTPSRVSTFSDVWWDTAALVTALANRPASREGVSVSDFFLTSEGPDGPCSVGVRGADAQRPHAASRGVRGAKPPGEKFLCRGAALHLLSPRLMPRPAVA